MKFSLLLVDDEKNVLSFLKRVFLKDDYEIHTAANGMDALDIIGRIRVDAALIDLKMPGMDGFTLLREIKKSYSEIMVIILTGRGGISEAVEAIKLGALDFLEKPFPPQGLHTRIEQLYRIWALKEENRNLKERIECQFGFDRLAGNSTVMLKLKQMISRIAPADASVLIQGETGTGKELVARAIHYHSLRSEENFIPVDCAAISETVIESELFGHVKGAFTGAYTSTLGLIRSADKGTLFFDEIGELSPSIQAKILRTIQEGVVRPVGSVDNYPVNIRIVSATNRNLTKEIGGGNFREDLFYRLNVVTVQVPPLRERMDDILLLVKYFLKRFDTDISPVKNISPEALVCLENYNWPGNVRELENVIRRAVALGRENMILPEDLPPNISGRSIENSSTKTDPPAGEKLEDYERKAIKNALLKSGYNRRKASRILDIGEATLYRKIKKYQIMD